MQGDNSGITKRQSFIIAGIMLTIILLYVIRLFSMQVVDNYIYRSQADEVSKRRQTIPTRRGEIFDRNFDQPLTTNTDTFAILLDLSQVPADGLQNLMKRLSEVLHTQSDFLWSKIPVRRNQNFTAYEIWNSAKYREIAFIAERIEEFPGISWESRPSRFYPNGAFLSHVLGYTGEITVEELQILYNQGYSGARKVGKSGIERQYDDLLCGVEGIRLGRVDARGRRVQDLEDVPPVLGKSLVLTIDRHVQLLVEKALGERTGSAVVMDSSNGEIIAMASYPDYDPNLFYTAGTEEGITALNNNFRSPLLNRTIQSAGSPASTFKTLMSIAMLQEKAFDPYEEIYCSGSIVVGDRTFRCHNRSGHGSLNMFEAIAESCNVYFYTIGKDYLGVNGILDYALNFGFGDYTGIDLPGEIRGLLPDSQWKEKTYGIPWVGGDTVNLSIGQGYLTVTPMQMALLVAAIVNGGVIYQPHLLKEIRDQSTLELIERYEPRVYRNLGIDREVFDAIKVGMRKVIDNGTARAVFTTTDIEIAGKTGTGQTADEEHRHSWFISYAPYQTTPGESQYVVVVWVDADNEWEWWAPKAANIIIHGMMHELTFEDTIRDLQPLWYFPLSQLDDAATQIES